MGPTMGMTKGGLPLLSLDAVVIDTETTGLDPRKARVVELGAVRLSRGQLLLDDSVRQLLRPVNESIPATATRIHGIDDAAVAESPPFGDVWPRFETFLGQGVVIGHTIGFDLAVLKRECDLAGLPWVRPRTLDTRLLAEVAAPDLAGYALEKLAAWLDVDVTGRHSASGDAITTARIFLALIPKLRDCGIRTVAEAERACRALSGRLGDEAHIGWVEAVEAPDRIDAEQMVKRVDSYPYRHRNCDIMQTPPLFVTTDARIGDALARMMRENVSSLYVSNPETDMDDVKAAEAGVITERDVLRAIDGLGAGVLELPVSRIMSRPLAAVAADAFVYRAIGRMSRLNVRHLGVVDETGRVIGALSARDLLRPHTAEAILLGDEIDVAPDARALSAAWGKLAPVAESLVREGLSGRDVAEVISSELCALTRRTAVIAEGLMREGGHGGPPSSYALVVLGSAGRGESLLAIDQDNAVIFERGEPGGSEDRWFAAFGAHVADLLHEAGVPYCKGGVMARNEAWRGSVATWRNRIDHWISRSNPNDLLSVDIFFDLRAVHGDGGLALAVRRAAFDAAVGQVAFAKLLVQGIDTPASLKFFGGIRTEGGRIDLKRAGLFGLVSAARALAIRHGVEARSTPARLAGIKARANASESDIDALEEAHGVFLDLILAQQIADVHQGMTPSNTVAVKQLTVREYNRLRAGLEAVTAIDVLTQDLLFNG